jgi:proteasome lid subunit RPN8/RPN11
VLSKRVAEIRLENCARVVMIEAAIAASTRECCGALIGRTDSTGAVVLEAWPLTNHADDAEREYLIPADNVLAVEERARACGLDVLGFYHSHPDGSTVPSASDLERAWPGYLYAVVDATAGALSFWKLQEDRSKFLRLEVGEP